MSKAPLASALLLFALAGTAFANPDVPVNLPLKEMTALPPGARFLPQTEVNQLVFECPSPSDIPGGNVGTGGSAVVVKDGNFPNFPPAQGVTYPLTVNGFAFGWIAFGPATVGSFDIQITFFDDIDMTIDAPAPFYSNQLGGFRFNNVTPEWNFVQWYQAPLALVDGLGNPITVTFPDSSWGYETKIFINGTDALWHGANFPGGSSLNSLTQVVPLARQPLVSVGSSGFTYHFNDAVTQDTALGLDHTVLNDALHTRGSFAAPRNIYLKLQADLNEPPAADAIDLVTGLDLLGATPTTLDCTTSDTVSQTFTINPGQVNFYGFTLGPNGATSAANTYLDITTVTDFVDSSMALYSSAGVLIKSDDDSGEILNPALTFGHGRRPAVGDSIQFDGHHGDLVGGGSFYIAVGGFGTTYGSAAFTVNGANHVEFGDVTVTVTHNVSATGADCALPTPVAPNAVALGLLPEGITTTAVAEVGFGEVRWLTFDIDYSVTAANPVEFLDISTAGSATVVDSELGLFDNLGNLIAENDDGCNDFAASGGQSLLSFGGTTPRPGINTCLASGQSGSEVPAGTYYLCVSLFNAVHGATGWEARSDGGSRLTVNTNFRTPAGCRADFNLDGNIDPDDLADFITCFFLDIQFPGFCPAADFNGDTSRDPDDLSDFITLFFLVVGGFPCS